jgi:hypothetical protein
MRYERPILEWTGTNDFRIFLKGSSGAAHAEAYPRNVAAFVRKRLRRAACEILEIDNSQDANRRRIRISAQYRMLNSRPKSGADVGFYHSHPTILHLGLYSSMRPGLRI